MCGAFHHYLGELFEMFVLSNVSDKEHGSSLLFITRLLVLDVRIEQMVPVDHCKQSLLKIKPLSIPCPTRFVGRNMHLTNFPH